MKDDLTMPADIRKIAEDVQKIEDDFFKKPPEETPEQKAAHEKAEAEKAEADKKAAEEEAAKKATDGQDTAPPEEAPVENAEAAKPAEETDLEKAEHKYKVLQGKYNKELPREREARKSAEEKAISAEYENSILRQQLKDLANRLEVVEKGGPVKAKETETSPRVTDVMADLENDPDIVFIKNEFPDVWKGMKKAMNKTYDRVVEGTTSKITKVEQDVKLSKEAAEKRAWEDFHKYLDTNVDGWRVVNKDPAFKEWLEKEEKHLGIKEAIGEMNAPRVAKFFVDFAKSKEPPKEKETIPKEEENKTKKDVMPPKGVKPTPPAKPKDDKNEIITQESISAFYERKRRGFYIGREAEMNVEEKKIEQAVVEGRVR